MQSPLPCLPPPPHPNPLPSPTLCDPRDGSTPGSPVPGILQARTLEWVAISFCTLEPLPRMRGRRAQPGSASRPRAGGLQGRVRLHVRGLPVPAGRSPGTPAAWGFEVCGGCLNLPARVDAAEDVCRASVWLSLPAGGGAEGGSWRVWLRVPPPGAGHVSLRAVCATCAGSCGAPGAGAGSPGGGKLCPGSISRGRSGCQVVITTHTHTSVSCLHFWGTWKEPEREEAAQTIPQSQEVLSARAHPQSSRGTVPLRA